MIAGVKTKELRVAPDERGRMMDILRRDEELFVAFGQVYLTTVYPGSVKAWHCHRRQIDNFACLRGMIKLVLFDSREGSPTRGEVNEFFIGDEQHLLVQIPPGIYHGFKGVGTVEALVLNVPTEPYDRQQPDEHRLASDSDAIPYQWEIKER